MKVDISGIENFVVIPEKEYHFIIDGVLFLEEDDLVSINFTIKKHKLGFVKKYHFSEEKEVKKLYEILKITNPNCDGILKKFVGALLINKEFIGEIGYYDDFIYFKNMRAI